VPIRDRQSLATAIGRLLSEPDLGSRLAETAFSRAMKEFSAESYRRRLLGFYAESLEIGH
jgi:hypothetical protein